MTEHYHSKGTADENIESLDISTKSCQSDFATAIDVKNENFIAGEIKKTFPDHMVSSLKGSIYIAELLLLSMASNRISDRLLVKRTLELVLSQN